VGNHAYGIVACGCRRSCHMCERRISGTAFTSCNLTGMNLSNKMPRGVEASAVLLTVLACLVAVEGALQLVLVCGLGVQRFRHHSTGETSLLAGSLGCVAFAAFGLLSYGAARSLRRGQRWAAHVGTGIGLLLLWFGAIVIRDLFLPYKPGAVQGEDFFELLIALPCVTVGLWLCIYLNLPNVLVKLKSRSSIGRTA
jgi:hypothetical protein